ncbi:MAG: NAD-dependent epimerase/dehydratase family protein [Acidimicrobiia bacterium]|nr:NAD-dependent epimerase/dehydratase family protein [Acidimicrobiia bacterium]
MQRTLVTGGAGFIGGAIVDLLVARGEEVVGLDCFHPAAHRARPALHPGATWVEADLADPDHADRLDEALEGVDAVCHQASMVGLGTSFDDIVDYVHHNSVGTARLLRRLAADGAVRRVVLASSCVVYGEQPYRCDRHGALRAPPRRVEDLAEGRFDPRCPHCGGPLTPLEVTESTPLDPRNVYATTKVNQEHLVENFARQTGTPISLLRYHNVYGPHMPRDTPYAGVASIFRSALEAGRPPRVFEDGGQRRDFIHVRDVARANLAALQAPASVVGPFNVATGSPRTVGEMATALARAVDPALAPEITGDYRLGDVRHIVCSPTRAAELRWSAEIDMATGMEEFATAPLRP